METNTIGKIFVPVPEPGYYPLTTKYPADMVV